MPRNVSAPIRRRGAYIINRPAAIRMLASPLRQAIVDAVAAEGPLSVAELSQRLRRPADRLYYHVKRLVAVGLLVVSVGHGPRPEERFDLPGGPMLIRYQPESSANRRAVVRVVEGMLRAARRDFARGFRPEVTAEGPKRRLWASRVEGNLTSAEIARLNRLLSAALALVLSARKREGPSARAHQLTWISSPIRA